MAMIWYEIEKNDKQYDLWKIKSLGGGHSEHTIVSIFNRRNHALRAKKEMTGKAKEMEHA